MHTILYKINGNTSLRYLLFVLLNFVFAKYQSQGGFKKMIRPQNSITNACANVIETPSGSFIALGVTFDTLNAMGFNRLTLLGSDSQGNEQWRKNYGSQNFEYYYNIEQGLVDSSGFYQAIPVNDPGQYAIGTLLKFNFQGDTIWQKVFRSATPQEDVITSSVCRNVDGGFLITGFFQNGSSMPYSKLLLIKTDRNGNEIWRKKIISNSSGSSNVIVGRDLVQITTDRKILICGYQFIGGSISYGTVLCTDSLGNVLWQKPIMNKGSAPLNRLIQVSDGNFIAVGSACSSYDQWGDCRWWKSAAVKFDIDGNVIWNKMYDSEGAGFFKEVYQREDKSIVIVGTIDSSAIHHQNGSTAVRVLVIDNNGEILGARVIGHSKEKEYGTDEIPMSLFPCKDKGFVIAARFTTAPNPRPYNIIKIDSTFCDTLEAYCRSVELDLQESSLKISRFKLFPNPTSGKVRVLVDESQVQSSSLLVYDLSGRLVKRLEINVYEAFEVDVSDLENGIYSVQVMQQGKSIGQQKLVLQR